MSQTIDAAAASVNTEYGHLDVLVNNAGIYSGSQPSRDSLRASLAVNVVGAASTTDAFLLIPRIPLGTMARMITSIALAKLL
jgi:NAD(P)-dependent dehydrogenase (short-subunit alcohol dehydrogenase family)